MSAKEQWRRACVCLCVYTRGGAGCKGYSEPRSLLAPTLLEAWLCMPLPAYSLPRHLTWKKKKVLPWQCPKKESALNLAARKSGQAEAYSNSGKLMTDKSQCLRKCCWAQSTYKEVSRTQGPRPVRTGVNIFGDRCREQSFLHPATNIFEQDWPHCQFSLGQQCYLNWDLPLCLARASASGWTALARQNRASLEMSEKCMWYLSENCK